MDWARFDEYGLIGIVVGVLFFILWRIIVWTMAFVDKITVQQAKEREAWQLVIEGIKTSMDLHNQQSITAHQSIKDGQAYQRAEHEKMINSLNEITVTLGRINGFKHD